MTDGRYHDTITGEFVSAEYAEANPGAVTFVTNAPPDRLQDITDELVAMTDSQPLLRLTIAGMTFDGTDRVDLYERALVAVRQKVESLR